MEAHELLQGLGLGSINVHGNLAFMKVYGENRFQEPIITVDQAFERSRTLSLGFQVRESGNQYRLLVRNELDDTVFIPGGSVIEGASQNRVVEYPTLLRPQTGGVSLQVRCVEQRQGLIEGSQYHGSSTIIMPALRTTEQHETWEEINQATRTMGIENHTQDYVAVAKTRQIQELADRLGSPDPHQVGYLAAVRHNGAVQFYADLFGSESLYRALAKKLHQSVATAARTVPSAKDVVVRSGHFEHLLLNARRSALIKKEEVKSDQMLGDVYMIKNPVDGMALVYRNAPVQVGLKFQQDA